MKPTYLMIGIAITTLSQAVLATPPDTEAVEFYNVSNKHYFITATASEARLIDTGAAGEGWKRTGRSFQAWLERANAPASAVPVCRFYSSIANSHFYTAGAEECSGLKGTRSGWTFEGIAFYIQAPLNGQCPAGTVDLLRVYNNGFSNGEGSNHRFVDDSSLRELMVDSRWVAEGTVFCAQPKPTGSNANMRPTTSSFETLAGTWKGAAEWEVEDKTGERETLRPLELVISTAGAISGTGYGCAFTGQVNLGDGFRSVFEGAVRAAGCTDTAFNGEFRRLKFQRFGNDTLMVKMKRGDDDDEVSISARLTLAGAATPPPGAPVSGFAGDWIGTVRWEAESHDQEVEMNRPLALRISSTGVVTGTGSGCTFTGLVGGDVTAAGCEHAIFNGVYRLRVRLHHARLEVSLERESNGTEAEIEGVLLARDGTAPPAPTPPAPPASAASLSGSWVGRVSWSAGSASGSDAIRFTIGADGAFSGAGLGCTLTGTLRLSSDGREASSGTVTAAGCTHAALNGIYREVEFEREDGNAVEFELEREAGGMTVKLKGKAQRAA